MQMLFVFLFPVLFAPLSGISEVRGEALLPSSQDHLKARKEAKYLGLRSALSKVWKQLPPRLLQGLSPSRVRSLRKRILARHSLYFVGMSRMEEKILPTKALQWSALYKIDVSRLIRDLKRLRYGLRKPPWISIYVKGATRTEHADIVALFPSGMFRLKFKKRLQKRCRAGYCLNLEITQKEGLRRCRYTLRTKKQRKGKQFFVEAKVGHPLFSLLPPGVVAALSIPFSKTVVVRVEGVLQGIDALTLLYLLQQQEPHIYGMRSFVLKPGGLEARFLTTTSTSPQTLFQGVFLGNGVTLRQSVDKNGVLVVHLQRSQTDVAQ